MLSDSTNWYDHIKYHRLNHGMGQRALAVLAGVTSRTVQRWESGECMPSASARVQLSLIFSVPEQDIFGDDIN